jgi:hypothetical protein
LQQQLGESSTAVVVASGLVFFQESIQAAWIAMTADNNHTTIFENRFVNLSPFSLQLNSTSESS